MRMPTILGLVAMLLVAVGVRCQAEEPVTRGKSHALYDWKAEDFFDDPQVIALCRAIEAEDLDEIDRLVAAGADVNAKGEGNMTPLYWAYVDNKLERFTRLLEHGADPNVFTTKDLTGVGMTVPGESVTHLACGTSFPGYFDAVFDHGGDPNLISRSIVDLDDSPLVSVIHGSAPDKGKKIGRLIALAADLNHVNSYGKTAVMHAVTHGGQYGNALILLEAGADFKYEHQNGRQMYRLIHYVANEEDRRPRWSAQQKADYEKLVSWLEANGESLEAAHKDLERFKEEFRRRELIKLNVQNWREKHGIKDKDQDKDKD